MIFVNGKAFATEEKYLAQLPVVPTESQHVVDEGKLLPDADDPFWEQEGSEKVRKM